MATCALFALTAGQLAGYEPETAAVTQGLVQTGQLRELPGSPLSEGQGDRGRGGWLYSRTGIAQPLLEVPFYFVGEQLDRSTSGARLYRWRDVLLRLYSPFLAALTVVSIFALLLLRGVSQRRALLVALLGAFCSLIWPYSKIGMDTTLMALVAVALCVAAWAAKRPSAPRFAAVGFAAGCAAAAKPYGAVVMLGALPLLVSPLADFDRRERIKLGAATALPVACWLAVILWYNAYRTGSITNFADPYVPELLGTPIHTIGLFFSPGRGLLLYSPLVILGLVGLRELWAVDRVLVLTIGLTVTLNTAVIATSAQWSDETWGPRYIVPSAWLLLLPIAWWARRPRRIRTLGAVALIAGFIQLAGVFSPYSASISDTSALSGEHFLAQLVPYGMDASRWIPQASPVLVQSEVLLAWVKRQITGTGFVTTYTPIFGRPATFDLRDPGRALAVQLPDFWWRRPGQTTGLWIFAGVLAAATIAAAVGLVWALGRGRPGAPPPTPASTCCQ